MDLKDKRILVTGGAGFIGSNLVDELVARGAEVIVLDDFSTGKEANLATVKQSGKLHIVKGSVLDALLVRKLVKESDMIFHMAVQCLRVCFDRPHLVHEVNATGTLNLLEAARMVNQGTSSRRIARFVYCSSSEVYGTAKTAPMTEDHCLEPTTTYGASKLAGELYTQAFHTTWGLPTVILRPFNTYGYREHHEGTSGEVIPRFAIRIMNDLPPIIFGDGSQTRDFTFVTDTVKGIITAGSADNLIGQTVNIARGQEVTIREIAEKLLKLLGKENLEIQYQPARPGDVHRHFADPAKLTKLTNYRAEIDIDKGLGMYIDWLKKQNFDAGKLLSEMTTKNWNVDNAEIFAATRH